jgi:predicted dienelactone hydrolase
MFTMNLTRRMAPWTSGRAALAAGLLLIALGARAADLSALAPAAAAAGPGAPRAVGLAQVDAAPGLDGPVTLYYPSSAEPARVTRGPFVMRLAPEGAPQRGNGRLVVISHGSGGSPWVHVDLATELVGRGYVVAMPRHRGDNHADATRPGPDSWTQRPAEVSRAIDAVAADARFAPLLALDRVGMVGQSAGGHTALSLAGGRWSRAGFRRHCEAHLAEDFQACVGLMLRLTGGWADGLKQWAARTVIGWVFRSDEPEAHEDPRIAAVVAGNPYAADFDMASLAQPRVPLGLVTTRHDAWLKPAFHGDRVLAACRPRCEHVADLATAGHGALLSPLPPGLDGLLGELLNDPPGFDRAAVVPDTDRRIADFLDRHLAPAAAPPGAAQAARAAP